jgi:hypothetical protein
VLRVDRPLNRLPVAVLRVGLAAPVFDVDALAAGGTRRAEVEVAVAVLLDRQPALVTMESQRAVSVVTIGIFGRAVTDGRVHPLHQLDRLGRVGPRHRLPRFARAGAGSRMSRIN